jgi:hypothetical protein
MLCADGSWLQVYHVTNERSKGMPIDRIESLSSDHDLGGLPVIGSDLRTYDLGQHPRPAPVIKILGPASPSGLTRSAPGCQRFW